MSPLLSRIDILGTLEQLLARVATAYQLGSIQSYTIFDNGYQELNVLLITTTGRFVIKIFSKEKTLQRIRDNIWGYLTLQKNGILTPTLQKTRIGEYIFSTEGKLRTTYLCVMNYFYGSYLHAEDARSNDISTLAQYMAAIHSHTKRIHRYHDTMGLVNLVSQYNKFKSYLPPDLFALVEPVVKKFSSLPLQRFRHSIIHGTFEPENILKNKHGDLCLLDLGCMDYNASIIDIATFFANFTIDLSLDKRRKITNTFLQTYQSIRSLTSKELASLPSLVCSQYAVYIIRTNYYRVKLKDATQQTNRLFSMSKRGLQQCIDLDEL